MEKVRITGVKDGKELLVECSRKNASEDWKMLFNGKTDGGLQVELEVLAGEHHPYGGTYYPDDGKSIFYLMAAFESYFFDFPPDMVDIDFKSDEKMDSDKEIIF